MVDITTTNRGGRRFRKDAGRRQLEGLEEGVVGGAQHIGVEDQLVHHHFKVPVR